MYRCRPVKTGYPPGPNGNLGVEVYLPPSKKVLLDRPHTSVWRKLNGKSDVVTPPAGPLTTGCAAPATVCRRRAPDGRVCQPDTGLNRPWSPPLPPRILRLPSTGGSGQFIVYRRAGTRVCKGSSCLCFHCGTHWLPPSVFPLFSFLPKKASLVWKRSSSRPTARCRPWLKPWVI